MEKKENVAKMVGDKEEGEANVGSKAWKAGNEVGLSGWPTFHLGQRHRGGRCLLGWL